MKQYNIDGLPGLTMQGTKGEPGKRGYTTFYKDTEDYRHFMNIDEDGNLSYDGDKFILSFIDSKENGVIDTVIPIPTKNDLIPIHHDYLIDNKISELRLYEIINSTYINFYDSEDYANKLTAIGLNPESIEFIISSIADYSNPPLDDEHYDILSNYCIYILRVLDVWEYSKRKTNILNDIEITVTSKDVSYPKWTGSYTKRDDAKCKGHTFERTSATIFDKDETIKNIASSEIGYCVGNTLIGEIFDVNTEQYILEDYPVTLTLYAYTSSQMREDLLGNLSQYNIISNSPSIDIAEFATVKTTTGKFEFPYTHGYIGLPPNEREEATAMILEAKCEGYLTSYYLLTDIENEAADKLGSLVYPEYNKLNIYMVPNESGTELSNIEKITKIDEYSYIDTELPLSTELIYNDKNELVSAQLIDNIVMTRFEVFSSMSEAERKKICIFAEFNSNDNKLTYRPSVRETLWKNENEPNRIEDNFEHPYGLANNYRQDLNFDNEYPESFIIVIKDFNEGNSSQVFISPKLLPSSLLQYSYSIEIFAYYKTTNAGYQKIYLGKGQFADTLE